MFQLSQDQASFDVMLKRVKEEYLTWVEQFLDIIEEHYKSWEGVLLNDIGCNVGQFWKGLKRRKLHDVEYRGYDIEQKYLDAALNIFPELDNHIELHDITEHLPRQCQVSVVSATLEHLEFLSPALDNILQTTESLILIRTFCGEHGDKSLFMKEKAQVPYYINQYSFVELLEYSAKYGFRTKVIRDRYTDSMPKYLGQGIVRTKYVIIGKRS